MAEALEPAIRSPRFQFTIRGLLVLMVGVAVGMSMLRVDAALTAGKKATGAALAWEHVVLAAVAVWIVLGLVNQVRDLWATFHGRRDLGADQRWGWRFAVFWRLGLSGLMIGHFVVLTLAGRGWFALPEVEGSLFAEAAAVRRALFGLCLLIVLASVPQAPRAGARPALRRAFGIVVGALAILSCMLVWTGLVSHAWAVVFLVLLVLVGAVLHLTEDRRSPRWTRLGGILAAIAGAVLCLTLWAHQTFLTALVRIAIMGIEITEPMWLSEHTVTAYSPGQGYLFFWRSVVGTVLLLVAFRSISRLARPASRARPRRLFWSGVLLLSLAGAAAYVVWLSRSGARGVSPMLAEAVGPGHSHAWVAALVLIVVFAGALAYRLFARGAESPELSWRRRPRAYYHERAPLLVLLIPVALLVGIAATLSPLLGTGATFASFGLASRQLLLQVIESMFTFPFGYLQLAIMLLALQRLLTLRRSSQPATSCGVEALPVARFAVVWLATFVALVLAIPSLAALSFGLWLGPWY